MNTILKFIIVFIYAALFVYVAIGQFIPNEILIYGICIVVAVGFIILTGKHIMKQPFSRLLLVATFFFLISVPLAGEKEEKSFEKRALAEFPKFRWGNVWKFFFGYQSYFNDRFAFRNDAVQAISKFRFRVFRISPMPQLVRVGSNDWLYTSRDEYILDTSNPFTEQQLDTVVMHLEMITKYFDIRNIKYYYSMTPIKERIYPEHMPADLRHKMKVSKAEQLYERLKNNKKIRWVNYKKELIEGKKIRPTYYNLDTHWNEFGAYVAYKKIIERIAEDFPSILPYAENDIAIDSTITDAGDLQLLMGFRDELLFERYELKFKNPVYPTIIDSSDYDEKPSRYSIREMPGQKSGLKLFLVRDSFSEYLRIFLTPHFDRTVLAWMPVIPIAKAVDEKPDIVIQQMLEQFVMFTLLLPPEIKGDTLFLNQHFPGYLKITKKN